jgi:hypothetical protein
MSRFLPSIRGVSPRLRKSELLSQRPVSAGISRRQGQNARRGRLRGPTPVALGLVRMSHTGQGVDTPRILVSRGHCLAKSSWAPRRIGLSERHGFSIDAFRGVR